MKTLKVSNERHKTIINKIDEIKKKYGITITIESLVDSVLNKGVPEYNILENLKV